MKPTFSLKKCIKERIEKEAWNAWSKESWSKSLKPRYELYTKPQKHIGWYIFFKQFVYQFRS